MTTTDLPAGPELDRLVAEDVMEWFVEDSGDGMPWFAVWPGDGTSRWVHQVAVWNPSTNMAHAWEVVERMRVHGSAAIQSGDFGWEVIFGGSVGIADTAQLAICRAALKAMEA